MNIGELPKEIDWRTKGLVTKVGQQVDNKTLLNINDQKSSNKYICFSISELLWILLCIQCSEYKEKKNIKNSISLIIKNECNSMFLASSIGF